MHIQALRFALATVVICFLVGPTSAQVANPELEACRSTGLIALRERNPSIKDVSFDVDGMTVAKANTKVEDTPLKTIVIGDAYLEARYAENFSCVLSVRKEVPLDVFH